MAQCSSQFGYVSQWTHRKALARPHSLSSSRLGFSHRVPGGVSPGRPCRQGASSRVRQPLNEPDGPFTRIGRTLRGFGPNPGGGFVVLSPVLASNAPPWSLDDSPTSTNTASSWSSVPHLVRPGATSSELCLRRPRSASPATLRFRSRRAAHWIEVGGLDRAPMARGDYSPKPPSSTDKHLSAHPALPVRSMTAGEAVPFSRLVTASRELLPS
jgi:hypothetical protein